MESEGGAIFFSDHFGPLEEESAGTERDFLDAVRTWVPQTLLAEDPGRTFEISWHGVLQEDLEDVDPGDGGAVPGGVREEVEKSPEKFSLGLSPLSFSFSESLFLSSLSPSTGANC